MLRKSRGPVPTTDQQVAALAGLEGTAMAREEPASLIAVHASGVTLPRLEQNRYVVKKVP
jgi:hypothetical protein